MHEDIGLSTHYILKWFVMSYEGHNSYLLLIEMKRSKMRPKLSWWHGRLSCDYGLDAAAMAQVKLSSLILDSFPILFPHTQELLVIQALILSMLMIVMVLFVSLTLRI